MFVPRLCTAGSLGVLLVASAHAQPSARLSREFQEGVDAYRLGEYAEARAHLETARQLDPKLPGPHRFLAAVALAEKRYDDCLAAAAQALKVAPESREVADTRKLHDDCRAGAGRPTFNGKYGEGGAIAVTASFDGDSVGAAVVIDGKTSGSTPLYPRAIPAGAHQIKVTKSGAKDLTLTVEVLPGIVTDVAASLRSATAVEGFLELPAELISATGSLAITVTIDDKPVAPVARLAVSPGKHTVVVRRGKQTWSRTVEVVVDKTHKLAPTFKGSTSAPKKAR
jgi:PEGA domain/Tetratricopeptide repeat